MGTWASIFVKTNDLDLVKQKLQELTGITNSYIGEFPSADLYKSILYDDNAKPNYLVFALTQPDWVMIRHNGFKNLEDWGVVISNHFNSDVIIVTAQSNASFYHFSVYRNGVMLREIEYCYGEDYEPIDIGNRFEFEGENTGNKIEFNGEVDYIFDFDSIEEYSKHFGLEVSPSDNIDEWIILKSDKVEVSSNITKKSSKPWWKFW